MPRVEPPAFAVVDASVAVRWVVPERGSLEAADLLTQPIAWLAPRLLMTEIAGALRRKVVAGELTAEMSLQAIAAIADAVDDGVVRLAEDEDLVPTALALALTVDHKVPDCVYLALAEREGSALASADRRLLAIARARGIPVIAVPSV